MEKNNNIENIERCPHCGNEDTVVIGWGEGFTAYYSCSACGHNYILDLSKIMKQDDDDKDE